MADPQIRHELTNLMGRVDDLADRVSELERRHDDEREVQDRLDDLRERIAYCQTAVSRHAVREDQHRNAMADLQARVERLEQDNNDGVLPILNLQNRVERLEEQQPSGKPDNRTRRGVGVSVNDLGYTTDANECVSCERKSYRYTVAIGYVSHPLCSECLIELASKTQESWECL